MHRSEDGVEVHGFAQPRSAFPDVADRLLRYTIFFGNDSGLRGLSFLDFSGQDFESLSWIISMTCSGCKITLVLHASILEIFVGNVSCEDFLDFPSAVALDSAKHMTTLC